MIADDTPYSGLHTDPLRLKHAAATKLSLTVLFDGEPSNVNQFKPDVIDRMKSAGLKAEFNVKVGENPRLDAIAEDAAASHYASKQHRSCIAEFINNFYYLVFKRGNSIQIKMRNESSLDASSHDSSLYFLT